MAEQTFRQPSTTQAHFSEVPHAETERSTFDKSHAWKGTIARAGDVVPMFLDEIVPGDTFDVNATVFLRLATPLKPLMDNLYAQIHYFFVPNRLLWDDWELFMGDDRGSRDPESVSIPQAIIDLEDAANYNTVPDYFGLPIGQPAVVSVSDLPFRAYALCNYEWYIDQNINNGTLPPDRDGATNNRTAAPTIDRAKRRDYFTSALPFPQKGDQVVIPIGKTAKVIGDPTTDLRPFYTINGVSNVQFGHAAGGDTNSIDSSSTAHNGQGFNPSAWQDPKLIADLSTATATSINDLRTAFQIQRLLERDARGGTRYTEMVLAHFGVVSDDARMQRPEYLGAGSTRINVNPVASTVAQEDVPQGNLSGVGTGLLRGGFKHSFTEHGWVLGLVSIQSDQTYQQGLDRMFTRQTKYDFYWPALSHLGEQAIKKQEIFVSSSETENDETWGFQERYAEYRYKPSRICGQFRSNHPQSLDVWHLAQDFTTAPELNAEFIQEDPPINRVIAVPSEPHFLADAYFEVKATRPMPVYSVPGMIDHF